MSGLYVGIVAAECDRKLQIVDQDIAFRRSYCGGVTIQEQYVYAFHIGAGPIKPSDFGLPNVFLYFITAVEVKPIIGKQHILFWGSPHTRFLRQARRIFAHSSFGIVRRRAHIGRWAGVHIARSPMPPARLVVVILNVSPNEIATAYPYYIWRLVSGKGRWPRLDDRLAHIVSQRAHEKHPRVVVGVPTHSLVDGKTKVVMIVHI